MTQNRGYQIRASSRARMALHSANANKRTDLQQVAELPNVQHCPGWFVGFECDEHCEVKTHTQMVDGGSGEGQATPRTEAITREGEMRSKG